MINIILGVLLYNISISYFGKFKVRGILNCGLVGFSGYNKAGVKSNFNIDKIRFLLAWNAVERGMDASGIYTPNTGVLKDAGDVFDFLAKKDHVILDDSVFIGHVRKATVGNKAKAANAHPFKYGNLVLVHNGTLDNHWELCRKNGLKMSDYDVDSQVLAAILAKDNHPKVLTEFLGAAAVMFTNTDEEDTIYCFRNDQRPLFRGKMDDGMYISSIDNALKAIGCTDIKEFKENYLYTIKHGKVEGQVKLKQAVKQAINHSTSSKFLTVKHSSYYPGRWFKAGTSLNFMYGEPVSITKGVWYYCTNYDAAHEHIINVIDDTGKEVELTKYSFDLEQSEIKVGNYVVATSSLSAVDNKALSLCKEGDLLMVTAIIDKTVTVYAPDGVGTLLISPKFVRPAEISEVNEYLATKDTSFEPTEFAFGPVGHTKLLPESTENKNNSPFKESDDNDETPTEGNLAFLLLLENLNEIQEELREEAVKLKAVDLLKKINQLDNVLTDASSNLANYNIV